MRIPPFIALFALLVAGSASAQTTEAGRATSVTGVVSVQRTDGSMGIMARGSSVRPGDLVSTQPESRAVIELRDGAKLTLRPGTEFRIEGYRYSESKPAEDSTVLRLLKGGLRTITGLLGQRRPAAFSINTGTATIGIRGTDFLTRICEDDCARESKTAVTSRIARTPGYVARIIAVQGQVVPINGPRALKALASGDPIYAEDILETGKQAYGVLVFQDGTRVVLQEQTRFAVERYKYEPNRPEQGNVVFRLLRGGLRTLTGLIAKANNKQFQINTAVATIGVRGTGFDVLCADACADDGQPGPADAPKGLTLGTWQGCNVGSNEKGEQQICEGQGLNVSSRDTAPKTLPEYPAFFEKSSTPRPDKLKVDLNDLFGLQKEDFSDPGTYVQVKEGVVTLKGQGTEMYTLGKGEVGYIDTTGQKFVRLGVAPAFMDRDVFVRDADPDDYGCFMK